jgi:microcystin-dependent protein
MTTPFLGQLAIFSFNFAPKGWAMCNGALMPINQNAALFSLLGTFYGGNGVSTFALPNLQGRVPMHVGSGFVQGEQSGEESHTLILTELPGHTHNVEGSTATATVLSPTNNTLATTTDTPYATNPATSTFVTLNPSTVASTGGSLPHENRQPFLVVNVCIALSGMFPSRN